MTTNEHINLEAIWKEADALIHRMSIAARELHGLTWKEPAFKEVTDLCLKATDPIGDMSLAIAELGELYRAGASEHVARNSAAPSAKMK